MKKKLSKQILYAVNLFLRKAKNNFYFKHHLIFFTKNRISDAITNIYIYIHTLRLIFSLI